MTPHPGRLLSLLIAGTACAALVAGCPRPGAVAPGGRLPGATAAVEPVPPGAAASLPPAPAGPATPDPTPTPVPVDAKRGIPAGAGAWLFHPGPLAALGSLSDVASRYRLIAIDADPGMKKATAEQIQQLKSGGRNQVLGWLEVGSMDPSRPFWQTSGEPNPGFWLGPRAGAPGAQWIDLSNPLWINNVIASVARPLVAAGVDGFLLDHVALAEHLSTAADGPCDAGCRQGVLDAIARLRQAFPDKLLVVRGGTGDVLRLSTATGGLAIAPALDGLVGVNVFGPSPDPDAAGQLATWAAMKLTVNGKPLFLGTDDAVPGCAAAAAKAAVDQAKAAGLVPGVRDAAGGPCRP